MCYKKKWATKIIPSIAHLSYTERLKFLKLDTLFYRRRRSDLLQVYRIMNQVDKLDFNTFFELNTYNTRRNTKKYVNHGQTQQLNKAVLTIELLMIGIIYQMILYLQSLLKLI